LAGSLTEIFVLCGLVVHELRWRRTLEALVAFRRRMRDAFGLKLREEVHCAHFISSPGTLKRIKRNDRLAILRHYADQLASIPDLSLISVAVDKRCWSAEVDVYQAAWRALVQRFENTLSYRNFPGPAGQDERGMLFADGQPSAKLLSIIRKMRHHNPVPNQFGVGYRNLQMARVIEDANFRDSAASLMIQSADLAAYLLYQQERPNSYMKKSGGRAYYSRLEPIFCRHASSRDHQGIVRLGK
jgi:hypothetical protein